MSDDVEPSRAAHRAERANHPRFLGRTSGRAPASGR